MTAPVSTLASQKVLLDRDTLTEAEKWRYVVDNTLKKGSLGFLTGAALSLVVFRSVPVRVAATAFGCGFGIGKSYIDTRYILGHDVSVETVWTAEVLRKGSRGSTGVSDRESSGS
ncbi:hypothetical protein, conserved [Trypanosoma brucei gambiense DAL972]|uniref:MICOS complex subunit MIC10 n=2 Tax=Trypanosoma brucei TaxID=5691 RepID=D0A1G4_TRYB9|nr:hypothetical protein, conserved [Trypanosoma brucei gambiense DAL972]RHW69017.1 hypothetical protein DPX39_100020600 [Trypanosoma brucei equiperdum]CBH15106.1 hypothetical protein, conserved [Trypanosoma brucei gambiense DAL972]|eukprot:XP_011777372.1 hypothetical protein, conserved [Trypanosoma brucei gambiense DAL972]